MRKVVVALGVISLLAAACSSSSENKSASGCDKKSGETAAKSVLRCREKSVAFVEIEDASGTAVLVDSGGKHYALTNAHVVHPFSEADITVNGKTIDKVPVVGLDAASDIALLGPLTSKTLPPAITITDGTELERGDDLFLVGYPGDTDSDDLEATIASGIVSRIRDVKEFHQTYIQTDAAIGDGQSGGPLFDGEGNLVGISGLSFADNFALALSGRDVKSAMAKLLKSGGDDYVSLPATKKADKGTTSGSIHLYDGEDAQVLFLPSAPTSRTWHLTVTPIANTLVEVDNYVDGTPLAVSQSAVGITSKLTRELAAAHGGKPEDIPDLSALGSDPNLKKRETSPGVFEIPVKEDASATVVIVSPLADGPSDVEWRSDLPLTKASAAVAEKRIAVGDQLDSVLGYFDTAVDTLIDLQQGQRVELFARSPQGDVGFSVFDPDQKLTHLNVADPESAGIETYDDTDDGLYGLDAKTTYEPKKTGTYRIRLFVSDGQFTQLRFSVKDCTKIKCGKAKAPDSASS